MRKFKYHDLDGEHIATDKEILETYYPWWSNKLKQLGRDHLISEENCIDDFVIVNWAAEILEG